MQISCMSFVFSRHNVFVFPISLLSCFILLSYLSTSRSPLFGIPVNKTYKDVQSSTNTPKGICLSGKCSKLSCNNSENRTLQFNEIKKNKCNIYDGRWVYDNQHPFHEPSQCPFLSDEVSCRRNGRADSEYERWRWEPRDCKIPRFDGSDMLERLRGKRLALIGDSTSRNQWESLVCLLYTSIPPNSSYVDLHKRIFKDKDYDCSVEMHSTQFLVDYQTESDMRTLINLDTIPATARHWLGANVMVFNTGHWWRSQRWDTLRHKGEILKNLTIEQALGIAMKTWTSWVDQYVDPTNTTVFYRTVSPTHFTGKHWCYNQTQPIKDESYVQQFPKSISQVIEKSIHNMRTPVKYLNITKLSEYRKDAHESVYTTKKGIMITKEQRKIPEKFADCLHWCIPGLPDTWNQLLYISIALETSSDVL